MKKGLSGVSLVIFLTACGVVDPNDELKPLPGDKARIVRTREERIVGTGAGAGAGTGARR